MILAISTSEIQIFRLDVGQVWKAFSGFSDGPLNPALSD